MTLQEIKNAVLAGETVHWMNSGYVVYEDSAGQWFIVCTTNDSAIGLTYLNGLTLNGKEEQFYIK